MINKMADFVAEQFFPFLNGLDKPPAVWLRVNHICIEGGGVSEPPHPNRQHFSRKHCLICTMVIRG